MSAAEAADWSGWAVPPLDLQQALREALEALQQAFPDLPHPLGEEFHALWDAADRIEDWIVVMEVLRDALSAIRE